MWHRREMEHVKRLCTSEGKIVPTVDLLGVKSMQRDANRKMSDPFLLGNNACHPKMNLFQFNTSVNINYESKFD